MSDIKRILVRHFKIQRITSFNIIRVLAQPSPEQCITLFNIRSVLVQHFKIRF
jgi:hypothetical protein